MIVATSAIAHAISAFLILPFPFIPLHSRVSKLNPFHFPRSRTNSQGIYSAETLLP
jgi:hypothetical protein